MNRITSLLRACPGIALFFFVSLASADGDIETITVTASRTPLSIYDAGSAITILDRNDILRRGAMNLGELLRGLPGFAISQQGSQGTLTQARVRGSEANQVLVLIDGIEANDVSQGGEFNFTHLLASDIHRIEIVRGPQSALWGSDALAGVVNVITIDRDSAGGIEASIEGGSFDTIRGGLGYRYRGDGRHLDVNLNHVDTAGTNISRTGNENDGYRNTTASLNGSIDISENVDLQMVVRNTESMTEFDGTDFVSTGLPVDADNRTESSQAYGKLELGLRYTEFVGQSLTFSRTDTDNVNHTGGPVPDTTASIKDSVHLQTDLFAGAHTGSIILEYEQDDFEQGGLATSFGDPNKSLSASTASIAGEYRFDSERLNLTASLRHDDNSEFNNADSWRITGLVHVTETTGVFASAGKSIKNPTFTERFGYFETFIGNPDLKPEESLSYEIGLRQRVAEDRVYLSASYFEATLENEINGFVFDASTGGFTAVNTDGESDRKGAEVEVSWQMTDQLALAASYTWLDATEPALAGDITEIRRPEHTGSLLANYRFERGNVNLGVTYTGMQTDTWFPPVPPYQQAVELAPYTLVHVAASFRATDSIELTGRIENALDEDYEEVYGYQAPGLGAYAGIRLRF